MRIARTGGQWRSGPSALAGDEDPARRDPTRWAARVDVSQPAASRAHREPDGASSQSSATGVGAQTGTISPSSAMRPAPSIVSTSQAARVESTSSDSDRRRRSRTASPPVRSTRGGAGPQSSMASSTRASRSLTSPPAAASTRSVPIEVVAASGGVRATSWCSRPPRSSSATSRGSSTRVSVSPRARSVTVGVTTWSSRWSRSQRTPSDPGASRLTTPTGGPQTSRSSTLRADSGASATTSRISCGGNGLAPSSSEDGPNPAGWAPSTSGAVRTAYRPSGARHTRARSQSRWSCDRTSSPPISSSTVPEPDPSPATTTASRTWRCPRSRLSIARWTLARVPARAASEVRSDGAGRARSGRLRTSAVSCSSLRLRMSSARLRAPAAGAAASVVADGPADMRATVIVTSGDGSARRCPAQWGDRGVRTSWRNP